MNSYQIREKAQEYLSSIGVWRKPTDEEDRCGIKVKEFGEYFYVESYGDYHLETLYPGDPGYLEEINGYKTIGGKYVKHETVPNYRLVLDKEGNVVIDPSVVKETGVDYSNVKAIDENNLIIPIKRDDSNRNKLEHFKKKDGKFTSVKTFNLDGKVYTNLFKDKNIVTVANYIYDVEKEEYVSTPFNCFITDENNLYHIRCLASTWGVPYLYVNEFCNAIYKKMSEENLTIGYKKVKVSKEEYSKEYTAIIFINENCEYLGELYYVDFNNNFRVIENVREDNFDEIIKSLQDELTSEIDSLIEKRNSKNQIASEVKKRLELNKKA